MAILKLAPLRLRRHVRIFLAAVLLHILAPVVAAQSPVDHAYQGWGALLKKHVVELPGGHASQVRYAGFRADAVALKVVVDGFSGVSESAFMAWTKPQQVAFLVNAYNAFTVVKVLQRYPGLTSIRDFGTIIGNPWKDKFIPLLGRDISLDEIEHGLLRKPGTYNEPRVHYALNCASIGCPMLRSEAYTGDRLDAQLEDQARRFLSDRSRNRFNGASGVLEISKLFDWFKADWQSGYKGIEPNGLPISSREAYFARYAELLADTPEDRTRVKAGTVGIHFLDYDWMLNDLR
jgi:hypothetical protein